MPSIELDTIETIKEIYGSHGIENFNGDLYMLKYSTARQENI